MMSPATIRALSDEAARKAARAKKQPYVFFDDDEVTRVFAQEGRAPIPFIGSYKPKGWSKVEELFCDSSGLGRDDEPALSFQQFEAKVREYLAKDGVYGFAVTEAEQFQVYVGVYRKIEPRKRTRAAVGLERLNPPGLRGGGR